MIKPCIYYLVPIDGNPCNLLLHRDRLRQVLLNGQHVIVDRYCYSGVAYSSAKGLDFEWCKACDQGLLEPDLVVYLDIDPRVASTRGDYGQERYEKVEFQAKVRSQFMVMKDKEWFVVDATLPMDIITEMIRAKVNKTIQAKEFDALKSLSF